MADLADLRATLEREFLRFCADHALPTPATNVDTGPTPGSSSNSMAATSTAPCRPSSATAGAIANSPPGACASSD